jgi:hypothetical protein
MGDDTTHWATTDRIRNQQVCGSIPHAGSIRLAQPTGARALRGPGFIPRIGET